MLLGNVNVSAQDKLSLKDVILLAKHQSPDALVAKHEFRRNYWEYRSFTADYLPSLTLDATLPNINRSISKITLPDGSDKFVERQLADYSMDLAITQKVAFTGGEFFINSGLQRIDVFQDSTITSYQSTPASIGYRQPIFGYNVLKWDRKIAPLKYEEAEREYLEKVENIALSATNYFFSLLKAQINITIAQINKANTDTLYKIAKGRYNLGKIAENELLQMELSMLNAGAQCDQAQIDYEINLFRFKSFLGIKENTKIVLIPPTEHPKLTIDVQKAMAEALQNRPHEITNEKQLTEALRNLSHAKSENRFNANLFALFGLTQTANELSNVYSKPQDQQQLNVGIQIPILDWGVGKGKVKMAESSYNLIQTAIEQENMNFEQEILLNVMTFNMRAKQLKLLPKLIPWRKNDLKLLNSAI